VDRVIEPWLDDSFPDYDTEPVMMYANGEADRDKTGLSPGRHRTPQNGQVLVISPVSAIRQTRSTPILPLLPAAGTPSAMSSLRQAGLNGRTPVPPEKRFPITLNQVS
jgi:hypothetical protein